MQPLSLQTGFEAEKSEAFFATAFLACEVAAFFGIGARAPVVSSCSADRIGNVNALQAL
jgi:hypothetical protein